MGIRHNGKAAPHSATHYDGSRWAALVLVTLSAKQLPLRVQIAFALLIPQTSNTPPPHHSPFATPASSPLHPNSPILEMAGSACARQSRPQALSHAIFHLLHCTFRSTDSLRNEAYQTRSPSVLFYFHRENSMIKLFLQSFHVCCKSCFIMFPKTIFSMRFLLIPISMT